MNITEFLRDAFSFSKLDTFSKCPRKFFYRYIMKKRENTGFQLFGRAVHKGQEIDNRAKLEGRLMHLGNVLEAATEAYKDEGKEENQKVDVDGFVADHKRQLEIFEERGFRALIRPMPETVEAMFEIEVKVGDPETGGEELPAKISGFVDVVSCDPAHPENKEVVDYKTGFKPVYQNGADASLQFALYALGAEAGGARVVSFVKGGRQKPTCQTVFTANTETKKEKLLTWLADTLRSIRRCLKTGDYPKCAPVCMWCSPKTCDFYRLCYGPGSAPATLIQIEEIKKVGTLRTPDWRK